MLTSNLTLIEHAVAYACRRHGLERDDAEEFAATVNLRLVENDYALLRKYDQRSTFATFISVVIQRMALERRTAGDRSGPSARPSKIMAALIEAMPDAERLILQLRFEQGLTASQITRMLRIETSSRTGSPSVPLRERRSN